MAIYNGLKRIISACSGFGVLQSTINFLNKSVDSAPLLLFYFMPIFVSCFSASKETFVPSLYLPAQRSPKILSIPASNPSFGLCKVVRLPF